MKAVSPKLQFLFWLALAYTLGTVTYSRAVGRGTVTAADEGAFKKLLGDGRRLFAGQFVEMADVYFHSGMYPSIFDRANQPATKAVTAAVNEHDAHADEEHEHEEHEDEHAAAMTPVAENWLEAFIHRFRITKHSHLTGGNEREMLPWLKLAIELDPQSIETYTTAAYWLRKDLGRTAEAEAVLREGLRNNPTNYELLFEMGKLYKENKHDHERARNLWLAALKCWENQDDKAREDTALALSRIASNLGELEEEDGHYPQAIQHLELAKQVSPNPKAIQAWIERIRAKRGQQ
ncbi:MAG TPA: hypothetical protein PKN95_11525 [Verrucomicrobiota bacterium]|nr:hypothetical protein [Verrucomicrobiota bacterium]HNT15276.1 hypothetical protein [Verrucomicrobiota bacterium]